MAAEDGGGDELQLGTVPSLKPTQTAPTTTIPTVCPSLSAGVARCSAEPEIKERVSVRQHSRREWDHASGGQSEHCPPTLNLQ